MIDESVTPWEGEEAMSMLRFGVIAMLHVLAEQHQVMMMF